MNLELLAEKELPPGSYYVEDDKIYINNVNSHISKQPRATITQIENFRARLPIDHDMIDEEPNLIIKLN